MANESAARRTRWGLKGKLVLSMLLVGVIPLLVGLVMAFLQGTREIRDVSGTSFQTLAIEMAEKMDLVLEDEIARATGLARDPLWVRTLEARANESSPGVHSADIKLSQRLRHYYGTGQPRSEQAGSLTSRIPPALAWVTDRHGRLVASTGNAPSDSQSEPWWSRAIRSGDDPVVQNVAFDPRLDTYAFSLSYPISEL